MPNLAFSPGPQQPHGGEKENAVAADAGGSKGVVDPSARRRSSGGDGPALGRSPLERLCPDGESSEASRVATTVPPAAPAGGGVVACKRNSSCKCPDCDMAASVFGIDQLRQVGGGGVAQSPVNGGGSAVARSPPPSSAVPKDDGDRGPVPGTSIAGDVGGNVAAREEEAVCTPGGLVGAAEVETSGATQGEVATLVVRSPDVDEAAVEQEAGGVIAADAGSGAKKKGWGFRMARAVFSPAAAVLTPNSHKGKEAAEEESGVSRGVTGSVDAVPLCSCLECCRLVVVQGEMGDDCCSLRMKVLLYDGAEEGPRLEPGRETFWGYRRHVVAAFNLYLSRLESWLLHRVTPLENLSKPRCSSSRPEPSSSAGVLVSAVTVMILLTVVAGSCCFGGALVCLWWVQATEFD